MQDFDFRMTPLWGEIIEATSFKKYISRNIDFFLLGA
jgi:hypothetical protein